MPSRVTPNMCLINSAKELPSKQSTSLDLSSKTILSFLLVWMEKAITVEYILYSPKWLELLVEWSTAPNQTRLIFLCDWIPL